MKIKANSISEYLEKIPAERKAIMQKLISTISKNLPNGFTEQLGYGMPAWVVPHSTYPDGYHCTPELPLPFMNVASQKNFIAVYHMGLYANPELYKWFISEYPKYSKFKLDMGKSCIRFKKMDDIPYDLIGELVSKVSPDQWRATYEMVLKK